jgi:hypothetical protein
MEIKNDSSETEYGGAFWGSFLKLKLRAVFASFLPATTASSNNQTVASPHIKSNAFPHLLPLSPL